MQLPPLDPTAPRAFLEHDGFLVQPLIETSVEGVVGFNFVVRRAYDIVPDAVAQPQRWQRPLLTADVYYDGPLINPLTTPVRYESDLMPPKPRCDVLVLGHCYAPGGEATQVTCGVRIGKWEKRVLVIGDRSVWQPAHRDKAFLTPARPFTVMPLRWENSYGGIDQSYSVGPVIYPANPAGKGFWALPLAGMKPVDAYGPLPNLEDPKKPLMLDALRVDAIEWEKGPQPTGFGVCTKGWPPRADLAGMAPAIRPLWDLMHANPPPGAQKLPFRELQRGFYNAAPADQQIPYPNGGEQVILDHLHPTEPNFRFRLPVDHPRLRYSLGGEFQAVKVNIDTVIIEPDLKTLTLCWRGHLPAPKGWDIEDIIKTRIEVDGQIVPPAQLIDTGFPTELLTEGHP